MRHRPGLDVGALLHHAALLVPALLLLLLLGQQQHEPATDAVAHGVDAAALLHRLGVLLPRGVDDPVQDGHDLVGGDAREPHVDHEGLGHLGGLELDLLEQRGRVVGDGGGGRRRITSEEVGHEYDEAGRGILVGLDLVVGGMDARSAGEEEEEARGRVRVVGWLGDVDLKALVLIRFGGLWMVSLAHVDVAELDDLASGRLAACCGGG